MAVVNALLVRWADGYFDVTDDDSITDVGRHESLLTLSDTRSVEEATRIAEATLAEHARVRTAVEAGLEPLDNQETPYIGFDVGDTIMVDGADDIPAPVRVQAITASEDTEGGVFWTPELGDIIDSPDKRQTRAIGRMINGTLGGKSESAQPLTDPVLSREQLAESSNRPYATIVIAAFDSFALGANTADYVCNSTDAGAIINQAMASIPVGVDGRILLLEGTFNLTTSIVLTGDVTLEGQGWGTLLKATAAITPINVQNENATVANLRIQLYTSGTGTGILFSEPGGTGHHIRHIRITGTGNGINGDDGNEIDVDDCYIAVTLKGFFMFRPNDVRITNTTFSGGTHGVEFSDPGASTDVVYSKIEGCTFADQTTYSIYTRSRQTNIINNHFLGAATVHIGCYQYDFASDEQLGALIEGNQFSGGGTGVDINECHQNDVIGNRFRDQTSYGVHIRDGSDDNFVTSNRFHNITTAGVRINANQTDNNIVGSNIFRACGANVTDLGAATVLYDNN